MSRLYETKWTAYYKNGVMGPTVVYGEDVEEAMKNALAEYRKNCTMVDFWPIERVVDRVELVR